MESTHERLADRTGRVRGRPLESFTLWRLSMARFSLALLKTVVPPTLVCAGALGVWGSSSSFSVGSFVGGLFIFGFLFGMIGTLVLVFKVDAPGSTYCKEPVLTLESSEHELRARDASGAPLGDFSRGTLRVVRVNLMQGKRGLAGGLRLDHAKGSAWLSPHQWIGAWPGLRSESFHE
ncbi:MAG: hypothetical protein EOO71_19740 [Myxococcaceae bacterium]|nr:MAG: hypothetical protein EOO71_19740 [Myxococcaceae bacterium]